ncbi:unnamed protein product [Rhizoctonia solani]|uniref:Uncharacterized protein n=1 Tax=Rhizoctonia solani TaxID=456999 RepID=A0A8H3D6C4_9AGAM|nr:unnamed protein product [Rhizoctonia solani]
MPPKANTPAMVQAQNATDTPAQNAQNIVVPDFTLKKLHKSHLIGLYPQYTLAKANKGTRVGKNGKKYVWEILDNFLERFHLLGSINKNNGPLVDAYRKAYHQKIYNWFNNSQDEKEELSTFLSKAEAPNLWYADFPSTTDNAIDAYLAANKEKKAKWSLALFRSTLCSEYAKQAKNVQELYATKAKEKTAELAATTSLLTGPAHQAYVQAFNHTLYTNYFVESFLKKSMDELMQLIEKLDKKAGILVVGHISHEAPPNDFVSSTKQFQITSFATKRIEDYLEEQDNANSGQGFSAWLSGNAERELPEDVHPAVYPDRNAQNQPYIPPLGPDPRLAVVREVYHDSVTATYQYCGGVGPVPWTTIIESLAAGEVTWFALSRLPDPELAPFLEPRKLKLQQGLIWLPHLAKRQNGAPKDEHFLFNQTFGASKPPPDWSCALRPFTTTQHRNNTVHVLRYDGYIERSQAVSGIRYPKRTWMWMRKLESGVPIQESSRSLPTRAFGLVEPVISDAEIDAYKVIFQGCWDVVSALVLRMTSLVNQAEDLGPVSPPDGLWADIVETPGPTSFAIMALPLIFPQDAPLSTDAALAYIKRFWFPVDLFQNTRKSRENGTLDYVEQYLEEGMAQSPITHQPSGTLIGGKLGSGWLVRGEVMLLANIGASLKKFDPPIPAPEHYQLDRITESDWKRALGWGDLLCSRLEESINELSKSSNERLHLPDDEFTPTSSLEPNVSAPAPPSVKATPPAPSGDRSGSEDEDIPIRRTQPPRNSRQPVAGPSKRRPIVLIGDSEGSSSDEDDSDLFHPDKALHDSEEEQTEILVAGKAKGKGKGKAPAIPTYPQKRTSKPEIVSRGTDGTEVTVFAKLPNPSQASSAPNMTRTVSPGAHRPPSTQGTAPRILQEPNILFRPSSESLLPTDDTATTTHTRATSPSSPLSDWRLVPLVLKPIPLLSTPLATSRIQPEQHVFGPFLPATAPPTVTVMLSDFAETIMGWWAQAESALSAWYNEKTTQTDAYGSTAWNKASLLLRKSHRSDLAKASLSILLVHRDYFKRAQEAWPTVQNHQLCLANQFHLLCSMIHAQGKLNLPSHIYNQAPVDGMKRLGALTNRMFRLAFTLQLILQEIDVYERYATAWSNELERAWIDSNLTTYDDDRLLALVRGIAEWKSTTSNQIEAIHHKRQVIWRYWIQVRGYKSWAPEPPNVSYRFGTPGEGWMGSFKAVVEPAISAIEVPNALSNLRPAPTELEGLVARLESDSSTRFKDMGDISTLVATSKHLITTTSTSSPTPTNLVGSGVSSEAPELDSSFGAPQPDTLNAMVPTNNPIAEGTHKRARESAGQDREFLGDKSDQPGATGSDGEGGVARTKRPRTAEAKRSSMVVDTGTGRGKAGGRKAKTSGSKSSKSALADEETTTETAVAVRKSSRARQPSARARALGN